MEDCGAVHFLVTSVDPQSYARTGQLLTRRGAVQTPTFMPVGTQATVKSLTPDEVRQTGAEIVLANTYHLMLRPGVEVIEAAGGLHRFTGWQGVFLTDSGGFQVYSLAPLRRITEAGVTFRSHIDGSMHELTPEFAVELQLRFGSDILMPLDDVVGYTESQRQREAMERTHRWLQRAVHYFHERTCEQAVLQRPLLFGIAQGGFDIQLRHESLAFVASLPVDGIAVGGLSVGEPKPLMFELLEALAPSLPHDRPRYLMGVGDPEDLWNAVALGIDLFDCVHPTRLARHGSLFTRQGRIDITSTRFRFQFDPVDPTCDCVTCQHFSAAYLHHLFRARELLGLRLASIHNLRFMQRIMQEIRTSIQQGCFQTARRAFLDAYRDGAGREDRHG